MFPDRYYTDKLSAWKLLRVYEIAPPRVRQYLEAEIEYCRERVREGGLILELGCGYGRVVADLAEKTGRVVGIDTSRESLFLGRDLYSNLANVNFLRMDAIRLAFRDDTFDLVICIQNGLSAFKVDQRALIEESLRVTKPGGLALFSSYAEKFWEHRLQWFRLQAEENLLGEIDDEATGDGTIICKDGFQATTLQPDDFRTLTSGLPFEVALSQVDESSLFCEIRKTRINGV